MRCPFTGLAAYPPVQTPVWASSGAPWPRGGPAAAAARYLATASPGVAASAVHAGDESAGHAAGLSASPAGCSGATTRKVAPKTVSGRVVKTSRTPASDGKLMVAPTDRPIQLRCWSLIDSGQFNDSR